MWCSKILIAYDGSASSDKAVQLALSIAQQDEHIELVLAHVVKVYAMGSGAESALISSADDILQKLHDLAQKTPNHTTIHMLKGSSAADLLLSCAKKEGCDLIVMGSRGNGGVKGYLGSVSYAVVQASPIAVLIAKDAPQSTSQVIK